MPSKKQPAVDEKPDFESALNELEKLVEKMEAGDTPLEESLKDFERGVQLTRACQQSLKEAEQKVEILTQRDQDAEPEAFESDD